MRKAKAQVLAVFPLLAERSSYARVFPVCLSVCAGAPQVHLASAAGGSQLFPFGRPNTQRHQTRVRMLAAYWLRIGAYWLRIGCGFPF